MRTSPSLSLAPRKGFRPRAAQIIAQLPKGFALTAALLAASGCDQPDLKLRNGGSSADTSDVGTDAGVDGGSNGNGNNVPNGGLDPEGDEDGDGVNNATDNCVYTSNRNQSNVDGDAYGDACEEASCIPNPDPACDSAIAPFDSDGDGVGDADDNCPSFPNPDQANGDRDYLGRACDQNDADANNQIEIGSAGDVCAVGSVRTRGRTIPNSPCLEERTECQQTSPTTSDWVLIQEATTSDSPEVLGNGVDDNCDGSVDEGTRCGGVNDQFQLGDVVACGIPDNLNGVGICMSGFQTCLNDYTVSDCVGMILPAVNGEGTTPNGLDDNCDGTPDDPFNGQPCDTGLQGLGARGVSFVVLRNGTYIIECRANVQPSAEVCDGIDNDFDGKTDEGLNEDGYANETVGVSNVMATPGETVAVGVGECATQVHGNLAVCATLLTTKFNGIVAGAEVCGDHLDNDCDGTTDENCGGGVPGRGAACGTPVGECTEGRLPVDQMGVTSDTCVDANGAAVVTPAQEICDGLDNDCDGTTDENLGNGAACNHIAGCSDGVMVCAADGTVVCDTTSQVRLEDGGDCIDDNNDGVLDNLPKPRVLADGTPIAGETLVEGEACVGIALDADGNVVANADAGRCNRLSRAVSAVDGLANTCPSDSLRVAEIPMNHQDDDCDSQTDEDDVCHVPGQQAVCNVPAGIVEGSLCHGGLTTCVDGQWSGCVGVVSPTEDVCNGVDEDCNGVVDDGFRVGEVCNLPGRCGNGVLRCAANGEESECSSKDSIQAETCNRVDDDCNGLVDNGFNVGRACFGSPNNNSQCHIPGVEECNEVGDGTVCSTSLEGSRNPASREVCDGIDNNCDGTVDEGFNIGTACFVTCADDSVVNGTFVCRDQRSSGCSVTVANDCPAN